MQVSGFPVRPLTAALALACGGAVCIEARADDPNPYYIGASEAITHDSNVYRVPDALKQSDTYTSTGLLGGIDQPFGRQRFYANGSVRYNHFNSQNQLNNTSYGLNTGLDLSTVNHISGSLTYSANQNLFNYGGGNIVTFTGKNVEKSQQTAGRLSWGLVSLWSLDLNANHRSLNYSNAQYQFANLSQDQGSLGVTYRPSGLLTGGIDVRQTHGKYPEAFPGTTSAFNRTDLDFTGTWIPTGQSTVNGRVSVGRQKYNNSLTDNGVTSGTLSWDYRPTGRLGFLLFASRDTGAASSFFNYATIVGGTQTAVGDNSSRTTALNLTANYAVTGKISATATGRYVRRNLNNSVVYTGLGNQALSGTDNSKYASLGANYQALRNVLFTCSVSHDTRSGNAGGLSYPYNDTTVGCSGRITLQ